MLGAGNQRRTGRLETPADPVIPGSRRNATNRGRADWPINERDCVVNLGPATLVGKDRQAICGPDRSQYGLAAGHRHRLPEWVEDARPSGIDKSLPPTQGVTLTDEASTIRKCDLLSSHARERGNRTRSTVGFVSDQRRKCSPLRIYRKTGSATVGERKRDLGSAALPSEPARELVTGAHRSCGRGNNRLTNLGGNRLTPPWNGLRAGGSERAVRALSDAEHAEGQHFPNGIQRKTTARHLHTFACPVPEHPVGIGSPAKERIAGSLRNGYRETNFLARDTPNSREDRVASIAIKRDRLLFCCPACRQFEVRGLVVCVGKLNGPRRTLGAEPTHESIANTHRFRRWRRQYSADTRHHVRDRTTARRVE